MEITAVIPCLNEEQYVGKLLEDIRAQTVLPREIIVANCKSTDDTVAVAETYSVHIPLRIVQSPIQSASSARNTGVKEARTDYLLFLDADMRIPRDFVEQIAIKAAASNVEFVSPRFKAEGRHLVDKVVISYINFWIKTSHMKLRHKLMGIGGAMLVRKSLHDKIGGYNPELREFDDIDYCTRLDTQNPTFAFADKAVAIVSSRRYESQGRAYTILQSLPENTLFVRHIIRPLMKHIGIAPKWHDN